MQFGGYGSGMPQQDPIWLSWVAPVIVLLGAVWAILKWLFVSTVRSEMNSMHAENLERFLQIEKSLSRIKGRLGIEEDE